VHKPMRVASGHLLGSQEWGDPMRVTSGDAGSQEGVIVTFYIAWEWDVLICINIPFLTQCVLKP